MQLHIVAILPAYGSHTGMGMKLYFHNSHNYWQNLWTVFSETPVSHYLLAVVNLPFQRASKSELERGVQDLWTSLPGSMPVPAWWWKVTSVEKKMHPRTRLQPEENGARFGPSIHPFLEQLLSSHGTEHFPLIFNRAKQSQDKNETVWLSQLRAWFAPQILAWNSPFSSRAIYCYVCVLRLQTALSHCC